MEKYYKLTAAQAAQVVSDEDTRRINLYHKFGRQDYDNPSLYHLVLNMSRIDLDKGCELICRLVS
jgi:cytidylate kinase